MGLFDSKKKRQQKAEDLENLDKFSIDYDLADFVPYSTHLNEDTVILKNGELMQVIKVTGFNFEGVENADDIDLRATIRQAIAKHCEGDNFAFWINTTRRKKDLVLKAEHSNEFCASLNDSWNERYKWNEQYMNELYISVLIQGEDYGVNLNDSFRGLLLNTESAQRRKEITWSAKKLSEVTDKMVDSMSIYGARKLGIVKREDNVYYSEIAEYLSKIINLQPEAIPVTDVDLCNVLPSHRLRMGIDVIELSGATGKHYGKAVTIKEYHEQSREYIDSLLQLPIEFTIFESYDFIDQKQVLSNFENRLEYFKIANDKKIIENTGIKTMVEADTGKATDFGQHQITAFITNDDMSQLTNDVDIFCKELAELGVIHIREDIFLESCYWGQLPGNFPFLFRQSEISTNLIGGYASLYNFPAGKNHKNLWGDAVTVFNTDRGTPYFFNFHLEDNGHTLIVGPKGQGKSIVMNFLVAQASKFDPNIFYFDYGNGSEIFIRALGGEYHNLDNSSDKVVKDLVGKISKDTEDAKVFGMDMTAFTEEEKKMEAMTQIISAIAKQASKSRPTILLLDEAWKLVDNDHFAPVKDVKDFSGWLDGMSKRNIVCMFVTEPSDDVTKSAVTSTIRDSIMTQIFLPNEDANESYLRTFELTKAEFKAINRLDEIHRQLLLRHGKDSVIARIDLDGLSYEIAVLSANQASLEKMKQAMAEKGENHEEWLPRFRELVTAEMPSTMVSG